MPKHVITTLRDLLEGGKESRRKKARECPDCGVERGHFSSKEHPKGWYGYHGYCVSCHGRRAMKGKCIKCLKDGNENINEMDLLEGWTPTTAERAWIDTIVREHYVRSGVLAPLLADDGYLVRFTVGTSQENIKTIAAELSRRGMKLITQNEQTIRRYLDQFPEPNYNSFLIRGARLGRLYKIVKDS